MATSAEPAPQPVSKIWRRVLLYSIPAVFISAVAFSIVLIICQTRPPTFYVDKVEVSGFTIAVADHPKSSKDVEEDKVDIVSAFKISDFADAKDKDKDKAEGKDKDDRSSASSSITATFEVQLSFKNINRINTVMSYEPISVSVLVDGEEELGNATKAVIASTKTTPFNQAKRGISSTVVTLEASSVPVENELAHKIEENYYRGGRVQLDVEFDGRVEFRPKYWIKQKRRVWAACKDLGVGFQHKKKKGTLVGGSRLCHA